MIKVNSLITLRKEDFTLLLMEVKLPKKYKIKLHGYYLFFYEQKVYGLYECIGIHSESYRFRHNGFKAVYYKTVSPQLRLGYYLLRQENKKRIPLSIICHKIGEDLELTWHSFNSSSLISKFKLSLSDPSIEQSLSLFQNLSISTSYTSSSLIESGKYLYNQLPKSLKNALEQNTHFYLQGDYRFFIYYLANSEDFLCKRKKIADYYLQIEQNMPILPSSLWKYSLILNSYKKDSIMEREFDSIQERFEEANVPLNYYQNFLEKTTLTSLLENSDFVHYIGHGENQELLLGDNLFFESKDLQNLSKVPKVLILSTCQGISEDFIESFFQKGGISMLYFRDQIESKHMDEIFSSFYWQFFHRQIYLEDILLSLRRKFFTKNENWIKLRLSGNGRIHYRDL